MSVGFLQLTKPTAKDELPGDLAILLAKVTRRGVECWIPVLYAIMAHPEEIEAVTEDHVSSAHVLSYRFRSISICSQHLHTAKSCSKIDDDTLFISGAHRIANQALLYMRKKRSTRTLLHICLHRAISMTGTVSGAAYCSSFAPNTSPSKMSSCGVSFVFTMPASIKFSIIRKTYVPQFQPRPPVSYPFWLGPSSRMNSSRSVIDASTRPT